MFIFKKESLAHPLGIHWHVLLHSTNCCRLLCKGEYKKSVDSSWHFPLTSRKIRDKNRQWSQPGGEDYFRNTSSIYLYCISSKTEPIQPGLLREKIQECPFFSRLKIIQRARYEKSQSDSRPFVHFWVTHSRPRVTLHWKGFKKNSSSCWPSPSAYRLPLGHCQPNATSVLMKPLWGLQSENERNKDTDYSIHRVGLGKRT